MTGMFSATGGRMSFSGRPTKQQNDDVTDATVTIGTY